MDRPAGDAVTTGRIHLSVFFFFDMVRDFVDSGLSLLLRVNLTRTGPLELNPIGLYLGHSSPWTLLL
jgi:hypothetical protein